MTAEFIQEFSELKDDVPTITSMKQQPEVCQPDEMFGFEAIAHQHLPEMGLELDSLATNFFGEPTGFDQGINQTAPNGISAA